MAKSRQGVRARVSQVPGRRRRKQSTNRVERAFDDVKQLVSDTADRLLSQSGQGKHATKKGSAKKPGTGGIRSGRKRQAEVKKVSVARIRSGRKRQAATKKAARRRGLNTT
jgi:hypothetical protein